MKKMVKFLSIVMVISMMFTMTASAFAATGFVVPGGSSASASGSYSSGSSTGTSISANTKPSYYTSNTGETVSTALEVDGTAEAPQYLGNGDIDYEDLAGSDDSNIANNADFIMFIHDNLDNVSLHADGTIDTAYAIFGADVIEGNKEETVETAALADPSTCEHEWVEATCSAAKHCTKCGTTEGEALAHTFVTGANGIQVCSSCGKSVCDINGHVWQDNGDGTTSCTVCGVKQGNHVHSYSQATCTEGEVCSCGATRGDALGHQFQNGVCLRCGAADPNYVAHVAETPAEQVQNVEVPDASAEETAAEVSEAPLAAKQKVIHAEAISYHAAPTSTTTFASNCGSSLISALNGSAEKIVMTSSFDICNSTEYRITIDMHGKTVVAPGNNPAFVIKKSTVNANRTTISFTNGTIEGNGFYVCENGILNLGGLINRDGLDILVTGNTYAVYVASTGTAVIAQGTDLRCANDDTVFIEEEGQVRMSGGSVTCTAAGAYAVNNNGTFLFNSTGSNVNNSYGVITNNSYVAVHSSGLTTIGAGTVIGQTGIAVDGGQLNMYNGTVTGNGAKGTSWPNTGSAIAVLGTNPVVTASGGALRSEQSAAIMLFTDKTTRIVKGTPISNITLFSEGIITQQKSGEYSDFRVSKFTVNDIGYASLAEAINAANGLSDTTVTIRMGGDYELSTADTAAVFSNSYGANVIFDGNGYELSAPKSCDGLTAAAGKVTIQNVVVYGAGNSNASGIVNKGADLTVGGAVTIRKFNYGIHTVAGNTYVNDVYIPDSVDIGLKAAGGTTIVAMVTDDADTPVDADSFDALDIRSGWFKRDVAKSAPNEPKYKVSNYIDSAQSHLKYVEKDGYYEVLFNDEPTVEIVSAEVLGTYTTDDTTIVYLAYDKADATPVIFKFEAGCTQIDAVSQNSGKKVYPLFTSGVTDSKGNLIGTSGNVRIADQQVLMDLPAGVYDIQFTFANSSTIKGKMFLQVYPKVAEVFEVPNTTEMSSLAAASVKKYINDDYLLDTYNVADGNNFAVVMSELPMKIAIGSNSAPYGDDVTKTNYLEYYMDGSAVKIPADTANYGSYAGNYVFFISYADLNNLPAGQNYVFLDYGESLYDIEKTTDMYAYIYFPFTLVNSSVYINPTTVEWTSVSGTYANFTIKPDVLNDSSVYIDGENVDKAYWTYDKDTKILAIKASYLNALPKTAHTLEVITSQGKVSATVNTKIGLMPKNLDYHVYGGAKSLSFVASDKINKEGGIWIGASNPTRLDPSCYVWDSETGFTLSAAFLNRLALGTYYVSAYVWNGTEYEYSTTSFKVISASQASYNPSTGDNSNIFIWLIVLLLSAVAIVVIVLPRFRKKTAEGDAQSSKKNNGKK